MKKVLCLALVVALLGVAGTAQAAYVVTGSMGSLAATASFDVSGTNLVVTLMNTGGDVLVPADILTALFFDVQGVGALTPVSATLTGGSTVLFGYPDGGGNVGGEWRYDSGLAGAPGGASEGISSAGFGLFGNANFGGPDLVPPTGVDGLNYGITSVVDDLTSGNAAVMGGFPLIQSQVTFTLSGLTDGFVANANTITNIRFQYGTALDEPSFPPVPEPTSLLALGTGLLIVGAARSRKKRR